MQNKEIEARRVDAISRGVGVMTKIYAERAENSEIWDAEGNRYIDFASGIAVLNTGHRHPKVIEAVKAQLDRFTHTCHQVFPYENYVTLAERLNDIAGVKVITQTFFNEFAVSLPSAADTVVEDLARKGVLGGVPVSRFYPQYEELNNILLVTATELTTEDDIDQLVSNLNKVL